MFRLFWKLFPELKPKTTLDKVDAVILVDMQKKFVPDIRKGRAEVIIRKQQEVIRACAEKDVPIVVLEYDCCGKTIKALKRELRKVPRVLYLKKYHDSGFIGTVLGELLFTWNARTLLLMGVNAQCCVRSTASDALRHGFTVVTAPDLISGTEYHDPHDDIRWYQKNGSILSC